MVTVYQMFSTMTMMATEFSTSMRKLIVNWLRIVMAMVLMMEKMLSQQTKQKTQTLMAMELATMRMMTMTTTVGQQHKKPNAAELLT